MERSICISAKQAHELRFRIVDLGLIGSGPYEASIRDSAGPLYHSRGRNAFDALAKLSKHRNLASVFDFQLQSANAEESQPTQEGR